MAWLPMCCQFENLSNSVTCTWWLGLYTVGERRGEGDDLMLPPPLRNPGWRGEVRPNRTAELSFLRRAGEEEARRLGFRRWQEQTQRREEAAPRRSAGGQRRGQLAPRRRWGRPARGTARGASATRCTGAAPGGGGRGRRRPALVPRGGRGMEEEEGGCHRAEGRPPQRSPAPSPRSLRERGIERRGERRGEERIPWIRRCSIYSVHRYYRLSQFLK